ncbi:hypothetical protein nbrc107696_02190 [Gordonia spumicola]|uniref:RNA-binding S4 domain-containing protein n=1 Tax=Gordonia spumicola TaxID=589161 RepID=A0A7I9V3L3_9ACTN|nr:DUF3558 family protein [Gordonia spumicola]GED99772.1 hypothetical protein nbrc107696_02190 [Gordonia spumicola]
MATRIDSWIWAIRLTKTRSAAGAACRAGHVRLNGVTAKPSAQVSIGDRVTYRADGRERIVEVTGLIAKRVSAPLAAENYIDHSPPPPPREVIAAIPRRDSGAGRPTKRERRQLDQFRGGAFLVVIAAVVMLLVGACGDDSSDSADSTAEPKTGTGPDFDRCGGLTTEDVARLTTITGMTLAIDNPSTCEWRNGPSRAATASFNWYRGSPIGRERGTEQLSRDHTQDHSVGGQPGFIASSGAICEVGVAWDADFIEISLRAPTTLDGESTMPTDKVCDGAKALADFVVKRAS